MSEFDSNTDTDVLETLFDQSPLRVLEIAKSVDRHPITVGQTCARLQEQGHIHPVGRGLYEITECGKQQVEDRCDSSL